MKVDAHGHLHDDVGKFAKSRLSRALDRSREVKVTHSTLKGEHARRAELEAMPEADLKAALAEAKPHYSPGDLRVTSKPDAVKLVLRHEVNTGQVRKEVFSEDELERIESDRESTQHARDNAHAVLEYLRSDHPARSGGRTELPPGVRMVPVATLWNTLKTSTDRFTFDRELHARGRGDDPNGWEHIVDRQLEKSDDIDGFITSIVRDGMQPLRINPDDPTHVANGHHRLAMAVLMGIPAIPVSRDDLEDWDGNAPSYAVPLR